MRKEIKTLIILAFIFVFVNSKTKEEWKTRSVYQILTDRYAKTSSINLGNLRKENGKEANLLNEEILIENEEKEDNGRFNDSDCWDLKKYCGGTFKGITQNLDYIKDMGFNAIWISPILENTPDSYHGYHLTNLYKLNPNFGTEAEFNELVEAAHSKDIWIMLDVVGNHSGPVGQDFSRVFPFNKAEHYHSTCQINPEDFDSNQWRVENCRLADLPDFNHENEWVANTLIDWIRDIVQKYKIDGIRIDTIPEVPKWFWQKFSQSAGVYQVGEVFNGRMNYVSSYQECCLDGVLNYPLYYAMRDAFAYGKSLRGMESSLQAINLSFKDPSVLGVFVNNHDNTRFLHENSNRNRFINAIVFSLLSNGIPIVYYGDEQYFNGGSDPLNRETLFNKKNKDSDLYITIKQVNSARQAYEVWNTPQIQRYADDNFYAYTRGDLLALFVNIDEFITREITFHEFAENSKLCNIFDANDCVYVRQGKIVVNVMSLPKVYALN